MAIYTTKAQKKRNVWTGIAAVALIVATITFAAGSLYLMAEHNAVHSVSVCKKGCL